MKLKKTLSMLLVLCMVLSLMSVTAFAEENSSRLVRIGGGTIDPASAWPVENGDVILENLTQNTTLKSSRTQRVEGGANVGDSIKVTAVPDSGYYLHEIGINTLVADGESLKEGTTIVKTWPMTGDEWSYTFDMPSGDYEIVRVWPVFVYDESYIKYAVTVADTQNGSVAADKETARAGDTVTLTVTPDRCYQLDTLTVTDKDNTEITVSNNQFTMPDADVTVTASFAIRDNVKSVSYMDDNGEQQTVYATVISADEATWNDGEWYCTDTDLSIASRVVVDGSVNLILVDGATLTVPKGINVPEGSSLTIYGQSAGTGTLLITAPDSGNAGIGGNKESRTGNITINGGTIDAKATGGAAAIGSGYSGRNGASITIGGGTIHAHAAGSGNTGCGAGVGTGNADSSGCNITITGGTIEASGEYGAAGIGTSTAGGGPANVSIEGGKITATGGQYGPGIGSGYGANGTGTIAITGGEVEATGGQNAAGIGGGYTAASVITISGGTVTATGGTGGAGIGSGAAGESGYPASTSITISGGEITATGGQNGPGIGAGLDGAVSKITISNGTVEATGAPGIGCQNDVVTDGIEISGGVINVRGLNYVHAIGSSYSSELTNVAITGGQITALGDATTHGIRGNTTLSWTDKTDFIYINEYFGSVTVAEGKSFRIVDGAIIPSGAVPVNNYTFPSINNKKLIPSNAYLVTIDENIEGGTVTADLAVANAGDTVTLTVTPAERFALDKLTYTPKSGDAVEVERVGGVYSFTMPEADVTVTAIFSTPPYQINVDGDALGDDHKSGEGWSYVGDENGGTLTLTNANLTRTRANSAVIFTNVPLTIVLEGENTLTCSSGSVGISANAMVVIQGDGSLTISGGSLGIAAGKGLTISGTTVSASGVNVGIQVKNDALSITDSAVTAEGGAVGIALEYSSGSFSGSQVTASGTSAFGIRNTDGSLTIDSGVTDATGGTGAIFAEGGITLGDGMCIETPIGGKLNEAGTVIQEQDGSTLAKHAVIKAESKPAIKSHTLLLSGEIGVNFYVDLSMLTEEEQQAATMEFTVNSKTTTDTFDASCTNPNGDGYYGFTCFINSVQMADEITAVLHYTQNGEEGTVSQTYSAKKYVDHVLNNTDKYSANAVALVKAIADYGHYVQPFLATNNGWVVGTDHAAMDRVKTFADADVEAARNGVADMAIVRELGESQIEKVTYSLNLESETAIRIYLKVKDGYEGTVTATMGGNAIDCVKQSDGRYRIEISGISAHKLGDVYSVTVNAGGECTVAVSALSYVNTVLNSDSSVFDNDTAHYAVTALYNYYAATINYKNNPND